MDGFPVKQGDYVSIESNRSESIDENGRVTNYGVLNNVEIVEPTVTTMLNVQNEREVMQFFRQIEWQLAENIGDPPDYSFILDGVRVDVWDSSGQSLDLYKVGYGMVHLTKERSVELKKLLGIEESLQ
ncbi:hypothetical protein [Lysinibacillus sphaericus]|uniref:hypothetical protein n=1 Tax=Lysinibacillus sphaericus TaxID=1421 RepID=UPI0018CF12DA|nr:hypothetical protein [Lysinibacillus sphaericus]